jgi:hypothetical protein
VLGHHLLAASVPSQRTAPTVVCPALCNTACRVRGWFLGVCKWPDAILIAVSAPRPIPPLALWKPELSSALLPVRVVDVDGYAPEVYFSTLFRFSSDLFVALGATAANKRHHRLPDGETQLQLCDSFS